MIGKQFYKYPAVARFVKGHAYQIRFNEQFSVVRFNYQKKRWINKKAQFHYIFTLITDNKDTYNTANEVRILGSNMNYYEVRELTMEDIPLFMDAPNLYPLLKEILASGHLIVKQERKSLINKAQKK